MSSQPINPTYNKFKELLTEVESIKGIKEPFLAMSFLTLDVIPEIKITDKGLYDFFKKELI